MPKKNISAPLYAARIKALRTRLKMNQTDFAASVGAGQGAASKWEKGLSKPLPETFIKFARLTDEPDKLYFLEEAGVPASFFLGEKMGRAEKLAATELVAQSLSANDQTFVSFPIGVGPRTIPLIKHLDQLGDRNAVVDYTLSFPNAWLPEDADIQAARLNHDISPFIAAELIVLVDISRRDPDRLSGSIVIARTPDGNKPMTLRKDGRTYFLVPLQESAAHPVRVLRPSGDWSIIGRVVKWIGDAPAGEVGVEPAMIAAKTAVRARK